MFMAGNGMYGTAPSFSITVTGLMPSHCEEVYTFFNHNCVSTSLPLGFFRSEDPTNYPLKTGPDAESSFKQYTICPFEVLTPSTTVTTTVHRKKFPSSTSFSEASELPSKPVPARTSSKRSRAAEVHNLSEKRRRSEINEKRKALQNLIPNSNKTDKASILDDAIEYLKQLQLHVQILMMRYGLSSYPMCLSGGLQPMILPLPQTELNFNEGNEFQNCISGIASSANAESLVQPAFSFSKHLSFSNQSVVIPLVTNITTSDTSSSFHPSVKDALW